jgi:hypothetical protein
MRAISDENDRGSWIDVLRRAYETQRVLLGNKPAHEQDARPT